VNVNSRTHNDLLLTLCRAFGLSDSSFGYPQYCTGTLDALRA
jgi:hypothetical protein